MKDTAMDRAKALAILGLADNATAEQINDLHEQRVKRLKQRLVFARTDAERQMSLKRIAELDNACKVALANLQRGEEYIPETARFHIPLGSVLRNKRYVVGHKLGFGDCTTTFVTEDRKWQRDVAIKVIPATMALDETGRLRDDLARLEHKAQSLAHPNIARVFSIEQDEQTATTFLTMERLRGTTLRQVMRERRATVEDEPVGGIAGGFSPVELAMWLKPIVAALTYANAHVNHLGLRPENIWREPDGSIKVADFGVSSLLLGARAGAYDRDGRRTAYLAPEQRGRTSSVTEQDGSGTALFTGIEPSVTRAQADQYALAALTYEMASGQRWKVGSKELRALRPDLNSAFCDAVHKALSLSRTRRFGSVQGFADAIARAGYGRKSLAGPLLAVAASIALLLAIGGVGLTTWFDARNPGPTSTWLGKQARSLFGGSEYERQLAAAKSAQTGAMETQRALSERFRTLRRTYLDLRMQVGTLETRLESTTDTSARIDMRNELVSLRNQLAQTSRLRDLVNEQLAGSPEQLAATRALDDGMAALNATDTMGAISFFSRAEEGFTRQIEAFEQARLLAAEPPTAPPEAKADPEPEEDSIAASDLRQRFARAATDRQMLISWLDTLMVPVRAGSFTMGDVAGVGNYTERPIRQVYVPPFEISRTEITFADYDRCIADGACPTSPFGPDDPAERAVMPVSNVSYADVQSYLGWLQRMTGRPYRLPSEAEWEYAARAGATSAYPWGNDPEAGGVNCRQCGGSAQPAAPLPVGSRTANAFGLHDMIGNLWEWVADCWYSDHTRGPAVAVPREVLGLCESRVLRGGSWDNGPDQARVSYRARAPVDFRHDLNGFRIAYSPQDLTR